MRLNKRSQVIQPGGGERLSIGAATVTVKLSGDHTAGTLALIDYEVPAGFPGPPLHAHPDYDELFIVLGGRIGLRLGDEAVTATPGTMAYVAGHDPHTFANPHDEPARMLVAITPAGFEAFFRDVAAHSADGPLGPEILARLNRDHGVELVPS